MANNAIGAVNFTTPNISKVLGNSNTNTESVNETGEAGFADYLKNALNNVNSLQQESTAATEKLATGEIQDIHSVLIAVEKADLALQYTMAIRNKIMDAYSEIMRMQV